MIEVCNECVSQVMLDGALVCDKANYFLSKPGSEVFKAGAVCLHDPDLGNYFEIKPESKEAING